tara:strand:- start:4972 stop:6954 length:1983 start_codon:yes stop_codon:yes gene_type:complete
MSEATHFLSESADRDGANDAMWTNQIQTYEREEVTNFLKQLESMWKINERDNEYLSFRLGYDNFFNLDELNEDGIPKSTDIERISAKYMRMRDRLCELYHRADSLNMLSEENEEDLQLSVRINRLIDQVDDSWQIVFRGARIYDRVNNPTYVPINPESDPSIYRVSTIQKVEELSQYQQAILQCLKHLYEHNIKRYKGNCCEEIKTSTGCSTRAWKTTKSVADFVYSVGRKETWFELWKNLTSGGITQRHVINHLTNVFDMQFEDVNKDRHVWSFNNGIFIGCIDLERDKSKPQTKPVKCAFYDYESTEFKSLDQTIVSCKYFDQEFVNYDHIDNWYDVPTPHFQSILDYQKFDDEVCKWIYVMGGRLCYDVNEIDRWQIIPFLKGVARSGKSTLITKVFRKFYCSDDVSTLSNNVERKFGLSAICNAFMFIAPEVKNDLALEQAEFQSIVSGEDVSIAVKHEKAKSMVWTTPGILGGNEVPQWKDNSGSILRRILTVNFGKQVKNADTRLDDKLEQELPVILQKCVRAYLDYGQKHKAVDIWNVVPEYFKNVQKQVAIVASTLENFLQSPKVFFDEKAYCPKSVFVSKFNEYCNLNNLGKPRFTYDFYAGPFGQREISVKRDELKYDDGDGMKHLDTQEFIFGIDITKEKTGIHLGNDH